MIFVIAIVVAILAAFVKLAHDDQDYGVIIFGVVFAFLGGIIACLTIDGVSAAVSDIDDREHSYTFPIEAAADDSLASGRMFLFGGSLNEEPMYFYYTESADGAITQGHIPVDQAKIYEDQETEGYIKVYEDKGEITPFIIHTSWSDPEYEIHVPKGSVVTQFNFDLEK